MVQSDSKFDLQYLRYRPIFPAGLERLSFALRT